MQAKSRDGQGDLYSVQLEFLCNETHPLERFLRENTSSNDSGTNLENF